MLRELLLLPARLRAGRHARLLQNALVRAARLLREEHAANIELFGATISESAVRAAASPAAAQQEYAELANRRLNALFARCGLRRSRH